MAIRPILALAAALVLACAAAVLLTHRQPAPDRSRLPDPFRYHVQDVTGTGLTDGGFGQENYIRCPLCNGSGTAVGQADAINPETGYRFQGPTPARCPLCLGKGMVPRSRVHGVLVEDSTPSDYR